MLKSSFTSGFSEQLESTNELFGNLSISLDSKCLKQSRHIAPKPKLKRLVKLKSSSISVSNSNTTFCSRCRKETSGFPSNDHGPYSIPEKEVDVKKDGGFSLQKKVHFFRSSARNESESGWEGAGESQSDDRKDIVPFADFDSLKFHPRRSSIVGDNDFWLPQRNVSDTSTSDANDKDDTDDQKITEEEATAVEEVQDMCIEASSSEQVATFNSDEGATTSAESDLVEFFNNIFKETIKREAKILQVATLLESTLVTLTDEYIFECRRSENTFEILNAIPLRDVQGIMVNDTCTVIVLRVCRASTLTEFKEFVPGFPEKTESLISMMVYGLSRINGSLPDVTRLPLLSLPNYTTVQSWYFQQDENIEYCGIATASQIPDSDDDFSGESFMMRTEEYPQFHPVSLLLKYDGQCITKCNGCSNPEVCKYSVKLKLEDSLVEREDHPWPNSVRLKTGCHQNLILACSSKERAEDLVEKLYCCIQPSNQASIHCLACVLVTEYSLQLFRMTQNKAPLFGSPLLNLRISSNGNVQFSCFIDTEGVEAGDEEILQLHRRWQLEFLSIDDKLSFMAASFVCGSNSM